MANTKDLFKNTFSSKIVASASLNSAGRKVESADYIKAESENQERFVPHIDFLTASNFCVYGSAKQYYQNAYTYIYNEYPYDGSLKERVQWELSGTYLDKYIFENIYPRTTGYIKLGKNVGTITPQTGSDNYDASTSIEGIFFKGGPHHAENYNGSGTIALNFTASNVYNAATRQESNLEINGTNGVTLEFWLSRSAYDFDDLEQSRKQVIFDVWNSASFGNSDYGRFRVELTGSGTNIGQYFNVTMLSGTSGLSAARMSGAFLNQTEVAISSSTSIIGGWNHYAVSLANSGNAMECKLYRNGVLENTIITGSAINLITGSMIGQIGSLVGHVSGTAGAQFSGSLSASLDELRFWKTQRTGNEIGKYWFTQVGGGTNTDYSTVGTGSTKYSPGHTVDLGVYYKFNEGVYNTSSTDTTDAIILDYSGRVSNGDWTGYQVGVRSTGSAILESSASQIEFMDPILYSTHPLVSDSLETKKGEGEFYDSTNNSSIFHTLPGWIQEDDLENDRDTLMRLCQIIGSYFDTLQLQVDFLPRLKDADYISGSFKPFPFTNRLVESMGINMSELFADASVLESFGERDDFRNFNTKLNEVKNRIYQNIYNNLPVILKSKGTEKSFRNLIRCYGVDENLIKLNLYGNNTTHLIRNNFDSSIIRKRYANFSTENKVEATVVQQTASNDTVNTRSYISSSNEMTFIGNTYQAEVIFPKKAPRNSTEYYQTNFLTSSIFGAHTVDKQFPEDFGWEYSAGGGRVAMPDRANFQVQAIRPVSGSTSVFFQLTGTTPYPLPTLTSSLFNHVYDNTKWNLNVRIKPVSHPYANALSGSSVVTGSVSGSNYDIIFTGYNAIQDTIQNSFSVTGTLDSGSAIHFLTGSKRFFVGAHRTNFTGTLRESSDAKISSLRVWADYLSDTVIRSHATDASSFGVDNPYRNAYTSRSGTAPDSNGFGRNVKQIPQMETLALNWTFDTTTGSNASGEFSVEDITSGSDAAANAGDTLTGQLSYGWLAPITSIRHPGQGYRFPPSDTGSISREFVNIAKKLEPDVLNSNDMIELVSSNDDSTFTRESRPISFYFAAEKSLYAILSDEILKVFSTIKDFNNLIGEPVNRYRMEYKQLEKLRELYFSRIQNNTIDFEKFLDYYKWADDSISKMLVQLFPASADFSKKLLTMVESHVLERNKYWTKYPTIDFRGNEIGSELKGSGLAKYPYKEGSPALAQSPPSQNKNCFWWKHRAERKDYISSGDAAVDTDRQLIHSSTLSAFNRRFFNAPVVIGTKYNKTIYGGSNYKEEKNVDYFQAAINSVFSTDNKLSTGGSGSLKFKPISRDIVDPNDKSRIDFTLKNSQVKNTDPDSYLEGKSALLTRFSLYSASATEFKNNVEQGFISGTTPAPFVKYVEYARITNYHDDSYAKGEVPMQGPFTEKYVGGRQVRHVNVNTSSNDTTLTRPESWNVTFGGDPYLNFSARSSVQPRAQYFRDEYAKRPVNIRNIKWGTSSANAGNYQKDYELLHTFGRTQNNRFFIKNEGFTPTTASSTNISGAVDFALPRYDLTGSGKSIVVQRFSSPGGPETMCRGALDLYAEEFSVYNALNNRNLIVRNALHHWQLEHAGQFGIDPTGTVGDGTTGIEHVTNANNYNTIAAYHKVSRNPLRLGALSRKYDNDYEGTKSGSIVYDNWYIQHPIPRSANQYAWITASISASHTDTLGYITNFSVPTGSTSVSASMPAFISESVIGSAFHVSNGYRQYGYYSGSVAANSAYNSFLPNDFVGINSNIYEPLTASSRTLGFPLTNNNQSYLNADFLGSTPCADDEAGGATCASIFNGIITHRQGPWGQSSWKQIRTGQHPVARYEKKNNILSSYAKGGLFSRLIPASRTRDGSKTAGTVVKFLQPFRSKTNFDLFKHVQTASVIEPPVSFKHKPLETTLVHKDSLGRATTLRHSFGNNLATFANNKLKDILGIDESVEMPNQAYYKIRNIYDRYSNSKTSNLQNFSYREVVYPIDIFTGLAKNRGRLQYAESASVSTNNSASLSNESNGIDRGPLLRRTFWRSAAVDRNRRSEFEASAQTAVSSSDQGSVQDCQRSGAMPNNFQTVLPNSQGFKDGFSTSVYGLGQTPITFMECSMLTSSFRKPLSLSASLSEVCDGTFVDDALTLYQDSGELNSANYHTIAGYAGMSSGSAIPGTIAYQTAHYPTASAYYYHRSSKLSINATASLCRLPWKTVELSGKQPWFDSYEQYTLDVRGIAKNFTILPEFRISQHMNYYSEGNFLKKNDKFLSLDGANISSSAIQHTQSDGARGFDKNFFKEYSNSDFQKYFGNFSEDLELNRITLKCNAVKKLLPYNGFYPVHRTLQLASQFSQSIAPFINGIGWDRGLSVKASYQNSGALAVQSMLQPYYAPGIMYNTVKAGIAVDWPAYSSSVDIYSGSANTGSIQDGYVIQNLADFRIPFESILDPLGDVGLPAPTNEQLRPPLGSKEARTNPTPGSGSLSLLYPSYYFDGWDEKQWGNEDADGNREKRYPYMEISPRSRSDVQVSEAYRLYKMAANNFFAEIPNFFLRNKSLKSIASKRQEEISLVSGTTYYMDIYLQKDESIVMVDDYLNGSGSADRTDSSAMHHSFTTRSNGDTISYNGQYFGPPAKFGDSWSEYYNPNPDCSTYADPHFDDFYFVNPENNGDPAYAPWAPPYFYGKSALTMEYTADSDDETGNFSYQKLFEKSTLEYKNEELTGLFDKTQKRSSYIEWIPSPASYGTFECSGAQGPAGEDRYFQIVKTRAADAWDTGASSKLSSSVKNEQFFEWSIPYTGTIPNRTDTLVGLNEAPIGSVSYTDIEFAIQSTYSGNLLVWESNLNPFVTTEPLLENGGFVRIKLESNGNVLYQYTNTANTSSVTSSVSTLPTLHTYGINYKTFYTSSGSWKDNDTLYPDATFYSSGSKIAYAQISNARTLPAEHNQMNVTASISPFGIFQEKQTRMDEKGNLKEVVDDPDSSRNRWVVASRMETPVLNFANQPYEEGSGRGMWSGYGELVTGSDGITFGIEETYKGKFPSGKDSLLKKCFESPKTRKVGELADQKKISEAIIAIPFTEGDRDLQSEYAETVKILDKNFFRIDQNVFNYYFKWLQNNRLDPNIEKPSRNSESITNMLSALDKYIMPPELDFLTFSDEKLKVDPFALYIFEFNHTLDSQDLADIWQGIMPKISRNGQMSDNNVDNNVFEHGVGKDEFFHGKKLPNDIRWMVFKVKRKSNVDYFKLTADTSDDSKYDFRFNVGNVDLPYSYNWPYDYFSLVELAEIEAETEFSDLDGADLDESQETKNFIKHYKKVISGEEK
jgi:hypothetical protein